MRALMLGLTGVVVLGLVAGCTSEPDQPEVSTVGLLKADDLGPGTWEGPYASVLDSDVGVRVTSCGMLAGALLHPSSPVAEASVVWVDGAVAVQSIAQYFADDSVGIEQQANSADYSERCTLEVGSLRSDPMGYFTWEKDGDTVVVHEGKTEGQYSFLVLDMAMTPTKDSFIAMVVSYPVGTTDHPDALELLDLAVKASCELPTLATQDAAEE